MDMGKGVIYIATSESYFQESIQSIRSLKKFNDVPVAVLTSGSICEKYANTNMGDGQPDKLIAISNCYDDLRDKIHNIGKTPWEKTLYLDTDTKILDDITPLFELLERVDIAAAHATGLYRVTIDGVPNSFPEFNTAVLAFNNNDSVSQLFELWKECHSRQMEQGRPNESVPVEAGVNLADSSSFGNMHGQPPFREALYDSDISYSVLPSEYNLQAGGRGYIYHKAKIAHGQYCEEIEKKANSRNGRRTVLNRGHSVIWVGGTNSSLVNVISYTLKLDKLAKKIGADKYLKQFVD